MTSGPSRKEKSKRFVMEALLGFHVGGERGAWAALRKISIRAHSWFNWLYPINF